MLLTPEKKNGVEFFRNAYKFLEFSSQPVRANRKINLRKLMKNKYSNFREVCIWPLEGSEWMSFPKFMPSVTTSASENLQKK